MPISYRAAQNLIKRGAEDELQAQLSNGLSANLANENGWTLLMLAAVEGSVSLGKLLLHYGADPRYQNAKQQTAEDIAKARGFDEFATLVHHATTADPK